MNITFDKTNHIKMSEPINITLYVGRPDKTEIEEVQYFNREDFLEMCEVILSTWENKVYLIAAEQKLFDQVFVEHNSNQVLSYIDDCILSEHYHGDGSFDILHMCVWIYIESSYESAYELALSMKEPTGLAYKRFTQPATKSVLSLGLSNKN
jgi:hypothetical protein